MPIQEVNKEFIKKHAEQLDAMDIDRDKIPNIDLYMDQLLHLLDPNDEKRFTNTQINNYTKSGLLNPPIKKKYSVDHVLMLVLIDHLKNVLSIKQIKSLFYPILDVSKPEVGDKIISIEKIYDTFLELKKKEYKDAADDFADKFQTVRAETQSIENEQKQDLAEAFLTVLMLTAKANIAKNLAEDIIKTIFEPIEQKDKGDDMFDTVKKTIGQGIESFFSKS